MSSNRKDNINKVFALATTTSLLLSMSVEGRELADYRTKKLELEKESEKQAKAARKQEAEHLKKQAHYQEKPTHSIPSNQTGFGRKR